MKLKNKNVIRVLTIMLNNFKLNIIKYLVIKPKCKRISIAYYTLCKKEWD